jgi:ATP-dependent DNA helicase RecG
MQALGVLNKNNEPTVMGILVCGKDPQAWLPGAYVQFVRYPGTEIGDAIVDQKQISAAMPDLFRRLDEVIAANITQSADLSGTKQSDSSSYPTIAVQELIRNALIHRNYEGTASPVMVNWYSDRIEITSPGGPYGVVTAATFGRPGRRRWDLFKDLDQEFLGPKRL